MAAVAHGALSVTLHVRRPELLEEMIYGPSVIWEVTPWALALDVLCFPCPSAQGPLCPFLDSTSSEMDGS